jgi:hypothetical protein
MNKIMVLSTQHFAPSPLVGEGWGEGLADE